MNHNIKKAKLIVDSRRRASSTQKLNEIFVINDATLLKNDLIAFLQNEFEI